MYIKVSSYWQNTPDYFVGPMSLKEAKFEIERACGADGSLVALSSELSSDVRYGIRVCLVTNAAAKSRINLSGEGLYNVLEGIPRDTHELYEMSDNVNDAF
jgi:hypothetical protein